MKSFYWTLLLLVIVGNVLVYQAIAAPAVFKLSVLDVGKGDAVLVQTPSGKTLLIDTGPDTSILRGLGSSLPFWQRNINAVVIFDTNEERILLGDDAYTDVLSLPKGHPIIHVSYGSTTLTVSSSTPTGVYISDGKTVTKLK